jgi:NADH-quinone oxidoreductase subunit N
MINTPTVDWFALSPTLALLGASGLALLAAVTGPAWFRRAFAAFAAFAGFVTAGVLAGVLFDRSGEAEPLLNESMTRDRWAALASIVIAGAGALAILVSWGERRRDHSGEYYALLAAAGAGMAFFCQASNLMTMFLGLEWFSIALYVMCAIDIDLAGSLEAGLKYLIVGSVGAATLLFGMALVYGSTGQLGFEQIASASGDGTDAMLVLGLALIVAGLAFKASAAPFHMWTPDVYQGAPTPVTSFMSSATKLAALVVTYRLLVTAFPQNEELWTWAFAIIACISLAVGNVAALGQRSVKRLLAYSSVSHAGFLLIAVVANSADGATALLYYLIPYSAMSLGAFAVIAARERELGVPVTLQNLSGFGWERPFHGVAMWAFMLGFLGFPLTGGFWGKINVFAAAYDSGWWWLIVVGVVFTMVSAVYYLAVVRAMFLRDSAELQLAPGGSSPAAAGGSPPRDPALGTAIGACLAVTIGSFFFVQPLIDACQSAADALPF